MSSHVLPSSYPHQYKNYEGFTFMCSGSTFYEFPILASGALFDGSTSPGPDRVVFEYVILVSCRGHLSAHHLLSAAPVISAVVSLTPELRATIFCSARVNVSFTRVIGVYSSGLASGRKKWKLVLYPQLSHGKRECDPRF